MNNGKPMVAYTEDQVLTELKTQIKAVGGQKRWLWVNKIVSIKEMYLSDMVRGKRHLSNPEMLKALGLKRVVIYTPIDEA